MRGEVKKDGGSRKVGEDTEGERKNPCRVFWRAK